MRGVEPRPAVPGYAVLDAVLAGMDADAAASKVWS